MSDPFLSEIKIISWNYAPKGWAFCNGQLLPINQNQALFALLGTTYGGDGQVNFALPDLRGRIPIHFGGSHNMGERAGAESVTLSIQQMPQHLHLMGATTDNGDIDIPTGANLASFNNGYRQPTNLVAISPSSSTSVGGSQAHTNMQPYLTLNFIIALQGIFPSPN